MAASRTISIRLGIDGAQDVKSALEGLGTAADATSQRVKASLEGLSSGDVGGKLANQLTAAATRIAALQKALSDASASGNTEAQVAIQTRLTAALAGYAAVLDRTRASISPLAAAEQARAKAIADATNAVKAGAASEADAAAARASAQATYDKQVNSLNSVGKSYDNVGTSTRNASTQLRLLGVQVIQTASGLATGQPILTTLIQQGHQVADSLLATGTGLGALKGAFGAAISAIGPLNLALAAGAGAFYELAKSGEQSISMLANVQQSLRGNQADFETLGQTVVDVGRRIASTSGLGLSDAVKVAQQFQNNRYFVGTAQDLERLSRDAIDLGAKMGGDAALGMKLLDQAMINPGQSAQDLASQFSRYLTPAVREYIKGLQDAGHQSEAFDVLLKNLEQGVSGFAKNSIGPIAKAWQDLGNSLTSSQDGWKPLTSWLANDFAQTIHEVTDLVNSLKDAWNAVGDSFHRLTTTDMTDKADELVRQRMAGQQNRNSLAPPPPALPSPTPNDVGGTGLTAAGPSAGQVWATLTASASKEAFVSTWLDAAKQAGTQIGVAPEIILSQLGLETGYGRSAYNYNLGNIKPGSNYQGNTFVNPGDQLAYRAYSSPADFMADYVSQLQRKFPGVVGTGSDVNAFSQALGYGRPGGYAEDPQYGKKLASVYGQISGMSATAATNALPLNQLMDQVNQVVGGGQFAGAGSGMLSNTKALAEAIDAARKATQDFKATNLTELLEAVHTKQDEVAASAGKDSAEYRQLTQVEQNLVAQVSANVDVRTKEQQDAERRLQSTAGLTEAEQKLNAALVQRQQALTAAGQAFTDTDADQVRTNVLNEQIQAFNKLEFQMAQSSAKNRELTAAYGQGNEAVVRATAEQQAYDTALQLFGQNIPADKLKELTAFYSDAARGAADLATAQQNSGLRDSLTYIQAESASLGENVDQRNKELAVLKAAQDMHKRYGDNLSDEAKKYIALTGTISDASAAYKLQESSLNELSGFFTNTFDTISNAITQAFATGNLQALKFKDILHSVASAGLSEFLKLAALNPLKNFLFGEKNPTLSSSLGVLGKLFGGSGGGSGSSSGSSGFDTELPAFAAVASTVQAGSVASGLFDAPGIALGSSSGSGASTASSGGGILGGLKSLFGLAQTGDSLGLTGSGGGIIASLGGKIVTGITNLLGSGITDAATQIATQVAVNSATESGLVTAGALPRLAAGVSLSLGATNETATAVATAASKVSDALPYVGAAISVITNLISGNIRGAALTGGGALVGAGIGFLAGGPPGAAVGVAIGSIVGGLVDAILPNHPLHPFDATALNAQGGQLAVGKTATQAEGANSLGEVQQFVTGINTFMAKAGIILANADGQLGAVGQGIAGMVGLVTSPDQLIKTLNFKNNPDDTSQFGVAKGALEGMSFPNAQALQDEILKIAAFADATEAIGIRLKSVGTDLTNIQVASVAGADQGNDLRTALQHDLTTQTFANVDALDAEINKVNQFVGGTIPGLLNPVEQTTSAIMDQVHKVEQTYSDAINQSLQYGLDNTAVLQQAGQKALDIVRASGVQQIWANNIQLGDRLNLAANGGLQAQAQQTYNNFNLQADQQRTALTKLWTDTYGDAIKTNQYYLDDMNQLEETLGAERVALVRQQTEAIAAQYQSLTDMVSGYAVRIENATGQGQLAQLTEFDTKAAQERVGFIKSFTDAFGDAILANETFQAQLATVDATHYAERLALMQSFQTQADQKFASLQDLVAGIQARGYASTGDQKDADLINFDIKARQELATFQQSFVDLYGPAITANENYQAQLTGLETVQGQERLQILQKYGDAVTGATADQLKAAQSSVTSLFTSLGDYVTKLQSGTDSPLSPTAQYDFAKGQFNAVAGAAAAGDATSAGKLTGFGDTFLSASRAIYGSGVGYATDFNRVLDAIQSVVQAPVDALTNSFLALQLQQQTTSITQAQQATTDAINALRREVMQQSRLLATAA